MASAREFADAESPTPLSDRKNLCFPTDRSWSGGVSNSEAESRAWATVNKEPVDSDRLDGLRYAFHPEQNIDLLMIRHHRITNMATMK